MKVNSQLSFAWLMMTTIAKGYHARLGAILKSESKFLRGICYKDIIPSSAYLPLTFLALWTLRDGCLGLLPKSLIALSIVFRSLSLNLE